MTLEKRQKILIPLIIIAFLFIIWQIYDLFFADSRPAPMPTSIISAPKNITQTPVKQPVVKATTNLAPETVVKPQAPKQQEALPQMPENGAQQSAYLKLMNKYQLLKLKRMLLDEEVAIASAQQKIAKLGGTAPFSSSSTDTIIPSVAAKSKQVVLKYIDNQNGQWSATITTHGTYDEVKIGDTLADGSKVIAINYKGLTIEKDGEKSLLSFAGLKPIKKQETVKEYAATPVIKPVITPKKPTTPLILPEEKLTALAPIPTSPKAKAPKIKIIPAKTITKPKPIIVKPIAKKTASEVKKVSSFSELEQFIGKTKTAEKPTLKPIEKSLHTTHTITPIKPTPIKKINFSPEKKQQPATQTQAGKVKLTSKEHKTLEMLEATVDQKASAKTYTASEKKLLAMPDNHYTIQIMGTRDMNDVQNIIKRNHLTNAHCFHTYYLGKDWYVLVYGLYKNIPEAKAEISKLPQDIQDLKPWVKSMQNVKAAIQLNHY